MPRYANILPPRRPRAFTLIEILVTVTIILILIVILVAVASNVRRNAQISATRQELQGLAGLIEEFQNDNHQVAQATIYNNTDTSASPVQIIPAVGTLNFVDELYVYPKTKSALVGLLGDKLHYVPPPGTSYIVDSFGRPIHFIPQNFNYGTIPSNFTPSLADRDYLRSSGPDQTTVWATSSSPQNSDDILSYEAAH